MLHNFLAALGNCKTVEEVAVVNFFAFFGNFILEEAADHELVERLAEAPRAGKQCRHRLTFD